MPMVKSEEPTAVYIVRCQHRLADGSRCPAEVALSLTEKAVCTVCGEPYPPYRQYATGTPRRRLVNQ